MCKYCENLFSGDASENLNQAELEVNGVFVGTLVTFLGESEGGKACISTVLMSNNGWILAEDKAKIEWCPVCGRTLNGT